MNEKDSLICVCSYYPLGRFRIALLLSYFGSFKKIVNAPLSELIATGLPQRLVAGFNKYRQDFDLETFLKKLNNLEIKLLSYKDEEYPRNLKGIADFPYLLFYKGQFLKRDAKAMAIVGSRHMSSYGLRMTTKFSKELCLKNVTLVSGLARGIDTVAHQTAVRNNKRTIAVLGCGLDITYPPENKNLAAEIIKNGVLISEYPPGTPPYPVNFVNRNRIISGLSRGVVVIEGAKRSGTLITASCAAQQGKTVFAVPGSLESPLSEAPLFLIKNGAKVLTEIKDILEEL
jgi:DNA processing protein